MSSDLSDNETSGTRKNTTEPKVVFHTSDPTDRQKMKIDKLMAKPEKPIELPVLSSLSQLDKMKPPKEFMTNIPGSSAGAGSGDFHIYRAHRRREYTRVKLMELESKKEREDAEFQAKRSEQKQQEEEKTAKRRAKRQKRKQNSSKDKEAEDSNPSLLSSKPGDTQYQPPSQEPPLSSTDFKMRPNPDANIL